MKFSFTSTNNKCIRRLFFLFLAGMVTLMTVYTLIQPAISMTDVLVCNQNEHIHSEMCYEIQSEAGKAVLSCGFEMTSEIVSHTHDKFCTDENGVLICPLEEIIHVHDQKCYNENNELSCGVVFHQHDENCFTVLNEGESADVLVCGMNMHNHKDVCYEEYESTDFHESQEINTPEKNNGSEYVPDTVVFQAETMSEPAAAAVSLDTAGAVNLNADNNKKYITDIKISYNDGVNGWTDIDDTNNSNLSASCDYRLEISYDYIKAGDLKSAGRKMVFSGVPDWLNAIGTGKIVLGNESVADMAVSGGEVLITFYEDYLNNHVNDDVVSGSFFVRGGISWDKIPEDGTVNINLPPLNKELHFENDLPSKYGKMNIDKFVSDLIFDGNRVYLKYSVTVTSSESTATIPQINVKDYFTWNNEFIVGYVGIPEQAESLSAVDNNNKNPYETRNTGNSAGTVCKSGSGMEWHIDELKPLESRTLNYYVEVNPDYIGTYEHGDIVNKVEAFSKDNKKCEDESFFTPHASVGLTKEQKSCNVDEYGNGVISYKVIVSAPESNSYPLENITLHDEFDESLKAFIKGNNGHLQITMDNVNYSVPYQNGVFDLIINRLNPGETKTITYTVNAKNIFASGNGDVELRNVAQVDSENRDNAPSESFIQTESIHTLEQNKWLRKINGGSAGTDYIKIPENETVYHYNGNQIESTGSPDGFALPENALKYQVILNEDGRWDMSSTIMKDSFNTNHMRYKGYVQISAFKPDKNIGDNVSDTVLLSNLKDYSLEKNVWLEVDGKDSFSFTPNQIGIGGKEYVYLLTYYAVPSGMENVGSLTITNNFSISGDVGVNGKIISVPEMWVAVNNVVQGGLHYEAEKLAWYYESDPSENNIVDIWKDGTHYDTAGAIYWIIRLEGTIPKGFRVKDTLKESGVFCYDSIPGVYCGSKSLDITKYSSFGDMIKNHVGAGKELTQLSGNKYNQRYNNDNIYIGDKNNPDYIWTLLSENADGPLQLTFQKDIKLDDDEALYIVVRNTPNGRPPDDTNHNTLYRNGLSVNTDENDESTWVDKADAVYYHKIVNAIYKEGKGAFVYDKDKNSWENISDIKNEDDHHLLWDKSEITESGVYSEWLVNVNWDGSLCGSEIISDQLPQETEFVYADICWIGDAVHGSPPTFSYIPELEKSNEWIRYKKDTRDDRWGDITVITYYNPSTKEIRWKVDNLQKTETPEENNKYQINIRVLTKIDSSVLLESSKTLKNSAVVLSDTSQIGYGTVNIDRLYSIKKSEDDSEEVKASLSSNEIAFKIEINPTGDDLCVDSDTLPTLVDELSNNLKFIEDSIKFTDSDGKTVSGYKVSIEENNGIQTLYVSNLPDSRKLTMKYKVRALAKPGIHIIINNKAYWLGYSIPDNAQYENQNYYYELGGSVDIKNTHLTVTVVKASSNNINKKLSGAEFELYEAENNVKVGEGITDRDGKLVFDKTSDGHNLSYNKIYYLKEIKAPSGYVLPDPNTKYYFAAAVDENVNVATTFNGCTVDIIYGSSSYSRVITNQQGEISIEKNFQDENGNTFTPQSGSYKFGLFDKVPDSATKPLQVLTIEYTENGKVYYLDGIQKSQPNFTCAEAGESYYIYELDSSEKPVFSNGFVNADGRTYEVTYSVNGQQTNDITVNNTAVITNKVKVCVMPYTGGTGLKKYYNYGCALILMSVLPLCCIIFRKRKKA